MDWFDFCELLFHYCDDLSSALSVPLRVAANDAGIAQLCLLSAAGSTARSRFRYVRVMGMKEDALRNIGFTRLAIFRPGIIVGNAHTPTWAGWL